MSSLKRKRTRSWKVMTACLGDDEDCWTVTDRHGNTKPERFRTKKAAQKEIDEIIADAKEQIRRGERDADAGWSDDDFYIVPA